MSVEGCYRELSTLAGADLKSDATRKALCDLIAESLRYINQAGYYLLDSKVPRKQYGMMNWNGRKSRPVNHALFRASMSITDFVDNVFKPGKKDQATLDRCLYTAAMSFPLARDLEADGDQKSPGTFFEILVGHIFASRYKVNPTRQITIPTLDTEVKIPTDFIFEIGNGRRIHLPIKISTRERVIQVWAHQAMLDGMHGKGRFKGILVCLTETNKQKNKSVVEVCLPNQWTAYQMFIAQLDRIYYFDVPVKYAALRENYPHIQVWPFSHFLKEANDLFKPV